MPALSSKEKSQFIEMIQRMPDEKVRYFYLMLGSALTESGDRMPAPHANTSPTHIASLQARFNR